MTFAYDWFRFERLMVAARCVGAAQRLVDEATAFATRPAGRRAAAGRPPAGRGHARRQRDRTVRSARPCSTRSRARSTTAPTARCCTGARPWPSCTAPRWPDRVADRAVQIFGGRGYMRENVAERMFRELRVERIWEGASEVQRLIVARQLLNRGPTALLYRLRSGRATADVIARQLGSGLLLLSSVRGRRWRADPAALRAARPAQRPVPHLSVPALLELPGQQLQPVAHRSAQRSPAMARAARPATVRSPPSRG